MKNMNQRIEEVYLAYLTKPHLRFWSFEIHKIKTFKNLKLERFKALKWEVSFLLYP